MALAASIPVIYANSVMAPTMPRQRPPVYDFLESQVNVVCYGNYALLTVSFTGTLITVSCFGRLALTPGHHPVTLVLFIGGGGPFVVEAGPQLKY